jgi:predicted Zn-dependent protease
MLTLTGNLQQILILYNCNACTTQFSAAFVILQGASRRHKIMKICKFSTLDKMKPDKENVIGLNLAVIRITTVQVTRLPLQHKLQMIMHNLLYKA